MACINEHESVSLFREYLRIPSVHPDVNYDGCVQFLTNVANTLKLPVKVIEIAPRKPIVIITWTGLQPELPSVMLNSHMDVVPVFLDKWTYDPFDAAKDEKGNIYARGSQDMKCVGIQYIETLRRYLKEGLQLKRTIHLTFMPDEEIGGAMHIFVKSKEFKNLNIGFEMDEGLASPTDEYLVYYAERSIWQLIIVCPGTTGHGSIIHENTAGEKIQYIINKFLDFREKEKVKLQSDPKLTIGDVTTINLTMLSGGVQVNVLPDELRVSFDVRVAIDVDHETLEAEFRRWCTEAGQGVRMEFISRDPKTGCTLLDANNPWWMAFKSECDKMGLKLKCEVFNGGTDSRYIRQIGIPALGFSPMNNTPVLLHDQDRKSVV